MLSETAASVLSNERLNLRPFCASDLPLYARMNADPQVMRYLGGPISAHQTEHQMLGANGDWAAHGVGKIAIERRSDGAFVGMCGLSFEDWYPTELELGWRLSPNCWGNGYATEAARAWLTYGFETLEVGRIISIADAPNAPSIAVMTRLGMHLDHATRLEADGAAFDAVIYACINPSKAP